MVKPTATKVKQSTKSLDNAGTRKSHMLQTQNRAVPKTSRKKNFINVAGSTNINNFPSMTLLSCDKCSFKCQTLTTLELHKAIHNQDPLDIPTMYACETCAQTFNAFSLLLLHTVKVHKKTRETSESCKTRIELFERSEQESSTSEIPKSIIKDSEKLEKHKIPHVKSSNDQKTIYKLELEPMKKDKIKLDHDYLTFLDTQITDKKENNETSFEDFDKCFPIRKIQNTVKNETSVNENKEQKTTARKNSSKKNENQNNEIEYSVKLNLGNTESANSTKISIIMKEKNLGITKIKGKAKKRKSIQKDKKLTNSNDKVEQNKAIMITKKRKKKENQKKEQNQEFWCDNCTYKTPKKCALMMHMSKHSGIKSFTCKQCPFRTCWRSALTKHMKAHTVTADKKYACDQCHYRSVQLSNVKRHKKVHSGTKFSKLQLLVCVCCKLKCDDEQELQDHHQTCTFYQDGIMNENKDEPHKCEKCNFTTGLAKILDMHKKTHEKVSLICDICGYTTFSKFGLEHHFRKHMKKQFFCSKCKFECKKLDTLERHMAIVHSAPSVKLPIYECTVCDKKFRNYNRFLKHTNVHTSKRKTYKLCELCDYKCERQYDLNKHMRSHTGEKPFQCEFCPHRCATTSHLMNHLRKHTGEKPYICKICGSRYTQVGNLKKHMRNNHSIENKGAVIQL